MIWYSDAQLRAWAELNRGQFADNVIDTADNQQISANITIDGTTTSYKIGDTVTDLAYKDGEESKTVSGTIKNIAFNCESVTPVDTKDAKDHFAEDVTVESLMIETEDGNVTVAISDLEGEVSATASAVVILDNGQEIKIADVLGNLKLEGLSGVSEENYIVKAFSYRKSDTVDVYIAGLVVSSFGPDAGSLILPVNKVLSCDVLAGTITSRTDSLSEIASALTAATDGIVYTSLGADVTIPKRSDGKITTLMINKGKELHVDLSGHTLSCEAYAFYVNGGSLFISDSTGTGRIECTKGEVAYPAIFVAAGGVCTMEGGIVDTTKVEGNNWIYAAVCSGDGIFNMTGGSIITGGAAGMSITNGTASGEGAKFIITGDSYINGGDTGVYLADNKSIEVSGNAVIEGGIMLRLGDLIVKDNAKIIGKPVGTDVYSIGRFATNYNGCAPHSAAILALTGMYGSSLGNDMNITIEKPANIVGKIDNGIDIATVNTKYDQIVNVNIENSEDQKFVNKLYRIYSHDECAEIAAEEGLNVLPETNTTTLTITVDGNVVYPKA